MRAFVSCSWFGQTVLSVSTILTDHWRLCVTSGRTIITITILFYRCDMISGDFSVCRLKYNCSCNRLQLHDTQLLYCSLRDVSFSPNSIWSSIATAVGYLWPRSSAYWSPLVCVFGVREFWLQPDSLEKQKAKSDYFHTSRFVLWRITITTMVEQSELSKCALLESTNILVVSILLVDLVTYFVCDFVWSTWISRKISRK